MKKCPYCAEEIQDEAIKCRYCSEFLDGSPPPLRKNEQRPWYFKTSTIVIGILCVGPLALPLLWFRPRTSMASKIGWSTLTLLLTIILTLTTLKSIQVLQQYYDMILEM